MNKQSIRAFGLGLLTAAAVLFVYEEKLVEEAAPSETAAPAATDEAVEETSTEQNVASQSEAEQPAETEQEPATAEQPEAEPEQETEAEPPQPAEQETEPAPSDEPETPAPAEQKTVSVTVEPGMSSYEVSLLLKKQALVQDAVTFNEFLVNNNYANKLQTGTFQLKTGASAKDIADTLTR